MVKLRIVLSGAVHDVGYRFFLLNAALERGLQRFSAFNTFIGEREAILVLVEGEREAVEDFSSFVKVSFPPHARLDEVKVEAFDGYVMPIDSFMLSFMTGQLNKGVPAILEIKNNTEKMLEKQDLMLEKQDLMLVKQDAMLERQDAVLDKQNEIAEEVRGLRGDVQGARSDFKEYREHRFEELSKEVNEIKKALAKAGII
jgi:acylphosphatase